MKKKLVLPLVLVLCIPAAACCKKGNEPSVDPADLGQALTTEAESQNTDAPSEEKKEGVDNSTRRIGIYIPDETTFEIVSVDTLVDVTDGFDIKDVLDAITLELGAQGIDLTIGDIRVDGDKATVDIQADNAFQPMGNVGSDLEAALLDCMAYSILDNFEEVNEVYYSVNGGDYSSGHNEFAKDEVYLKR